MDHSDIPRLRQIKTEFKEAWGIHHNWWREFNTWAVTVFGGFNECTYKISLWNKIKLHFINNKIYLKYGMNIEQIYETDEIIRLCKINPNKYLDRDIAWLVYDNENKKWDVTRGAVDVNAVLNVTPNMSFDEYVHILKTCNARFDVVDVNWRARNIAYILILSIDRMIAHLEHI